MVMSALPLKADMKPLFSRRDWDVLYGPEADIDRRPSQDVGILFAVLTLACLLIDLGRQVLSRQMFYIDRRFQSGYVNRCIRH
jgi:hypothetical protein